MKKILLTLILCLSLFVNTGCSFFVIGLLSGLKDVSESTEDPAKYGDFNKDVKLPAYYPKSISNYKINGFSYKIEKNSTLCYEIFLDLTLSEDDFNLLIANVNADSRSKTVKSAYHSSEYKEIVFSDIFEYDYQEYVLDSNIEKVIYKDSEFRIIFVLLYTEELAYYPVDNIEHFKKLNINPQEYSTKSTNEF